MMKKIIILFFVIVCFVQAKAQFPFRQTVSNNNTMYYIRGGTGIDSTLIFAVAYADTANANFGWIKNIAGAVIRTSDDKLWLRNNDKTAWIEIGSGGGGGGGVNSVLGTTNRITSSGGANPVIDIAATYVGQTSITTLGTITTGVWNGTAIANANLANSTISGVSLGSNLNSLTFGNGLLLSSGTTYNGSAAVTARIDSSSGGYMTFLHGMKIADSLGALISAGGGDYTILGGNNVTGGTNNFGAITSGTDNFALGNNLLNTLSSGSLNLLWGKQVAPRLTTASQIISIGYNNYKNVNVGNSNSAPGISIGNDNNGYVKYKNLAIGSYNISFNLDSAETVDFGRIVADNMAIGVENLGNLYYGLDNMVFSWGGLESLDSGSNNNVFGQYGLGVMDWGKGNNTIGFKAGRRTTGGNKNTFIGDSSGTGPNNAVMHNSTFLGSFTRFTGTSLFNRTAIGDSALVSQDNFMALGRPGTRVGIGRPTATEQLHLDSAILIGPAIGTTDGTIQWTGSDFQGRKAGAWKSFTAPSIADLTGLTSNSVYYVDNSGVITALALGANGTVLTSNGATSAPTFTTPAGGGDVSKVGTPVNNQVGVWTGDGTLEGPANLTFESSTLNIGVAGAATGILTLSGVTSGTITLQPASAAGTYTLTLPTSDGDASQVLTTNGSGVLTWETPSGGASWNAITNPTADQALTFDAGESSTWTDANTTEDLFTVNNATQTTGSMFSFNRTSTALASGNNIMELRSSGANGTSTITAIGADITVTNTGTSSTNVALNLSATGATNNHALRVRNSGNTGNFVTIFNNGEALFTGDVSASLQDPDGFDNTFQIYGGNNARFLVSSGSGYTHRAVIATGNVTAVYGGLDGVFVGLETNNSLNFITNKTTKATITTGGNFLLGGTAIAASATATHHIFNGTVPTGSVTNGVLLYSEDVAASAELKVRDEAGNITTLSPHNFTKIPEGPSEDMAWSFYSEKDGKYINVDMLKLARLVEKLTGEKLIYTGKK